MRRELGKIAKLALLISVKQRKKNKTNCCFLLFLTTSIQERVCGFFLQFVQSQKKRIHKSTIAATLCSFLLNGLQSQKTKVKSPSLRKVQSPFYVGSHPKLKELISFSSAKPHQRGKRILPRFSPLKLVFKYQTPKK